MVLRMTAPPTTTGPGAPTSTASPAPTPAPAPVFGRIVLDISNSVLPLSKLNGTPSSLDGLSEDMEFQVRSLGCDLIQLAGKLLRLPQVAMATGCVLFHRFYYAKSLIRLEFDVTAMACLGLACKIEECPRRTRDIISVFTHIRQVRSGKPITPVVLDQNYSALKSNIIRAERRVLKELGFCVHVKHPHKIIVSYLRWLEEQDNLEMLQMSWNFMNDSLRTDVFVRYPPETIAVACIYLSARKLKIPMPKDPTWFDVIGVEEDDIKDCCYRMIYELEAHIASLRHKLDESRRAAREQQSSRASKQDTPNVSSPASRTNSPSRLAATVTTASKLTLTTTTTTSTFSGKASGKSLSSSQTLTVISANVPVVRNAGNGSQSRGSRSRSRSRTPSSRKRKKHRRRSGSTDGLDRKRGGSRRRTPSRTPSLSPSVKSSSRKSKKSHHRDKGRHRSRSPRDSRHYLSSSGVRSANNGSSARDYDYRGKSSKRDHDHRDDYHNNRR
ncbi:hypothetical protein TCAL_02264 [Tigriopus californicus]|uniref:Cyclin-like domain-containing protein n=1 Tax=Tigriopus californicus TaxID=6832 RepID=A0A553PP10_TIGCA|nr:hypothetical protein TCAL_02264 [Tigriopus californicus]